MWLALSAMHYARLTESHALSAKNDYIPWILRLICVKHRFDAIPRLSRWPKNSFKRKRNQKPSRLPVSLVSVAAHQKLDGIIRVG